MIQIKKIYGIKTFGMQMKQFAAKDRIKIVRAALRAGLRPGVDPIRKATPRSEGMQHVWIQRRKSDRGWKMTPAHAADAITTSIKSYPKSIVGALWYRKDFDWYMRFLSFGYKHHKSGENIAGRDFATKVISERAIFIEKSWPIILAKALNNKLKRKLKKKGKRR